MGETKPGDFTGFIVDEHGAVIADGDGSGTTRDDYDRWTWKYIKAAISHSAAAGTDSKIVSAGYSDPSTLWNAALTFREAKEVLVVVGKSIRDQVNALAGDDGPWQGGASDAFRVMMTQFSKAFLNHAEQIDGGPARMSPVPEQLWASGDYLDWARRTVHEIDVHYANEVVRMANEWNDYVDRLYESTKYYYNGPSSVPVVHAEYIDVTLPNGLIEVSKFPQVVDMMTEDLRKVLKVLAGKYAETEFDTKLTPIPTPTTLDTTGGGGEGDNPRARPATVLTVRDAEPTRLTPATVMTSGTRPLRLEPGHLQTWPVQRDVDPFDQGTVPLTPANVVTRKPGGGTIDPFATDPFATKGPITKPALPVLSATRPPGSPGPGLDGPGGPRLDLDGPGGLDPLDPIEPPNHLVDKPVIPGPLGAEFPKGTGNLPITGTPPLFNKIDKEAGAPRLDKPNAKPFDPPGLPGGEGGGTPQLPRLDPVDWQPGGSDRLPDRRDIGTSPGSPQFPPFSPFSPSNGGGTTERPDSSGLLDGGLDPWEGLTPPGLGDPSGVGTPVGRSDGWSPPVENGVRSPGFPGLPQLPPMSPLSPTSSGGNERPDSAGLLDGGPEPWESLPSFTGDPNAGDTPVGRDEGWSAPPENRATAPGLPMMPPMSPLSPQNTGGTERPDSSGLLTDGVEPWESTSPITGDPDEVTTPVGRDEGWSTPLENQVMSPGLPILPPMASFPPTSSGEPERPASSALLGDGKEPWEGTGPAVEEPGDRVVAAPVDEDAGTPLDVPFVPFVPVPLGGGRPFTGHQQVTTEQARKDEQEDRDVAALPGGFGPDGGPASEIRLDSPRPGTPPDGPPPVTETPAPLREERIAVLRPTGADEDVSAWDVSAAGGALWFAAAHAKRERERDEDPAPHTPDYALRESTPWEHASKHTSRHVAPDAPGTVRAADPANFLPRAFQPPPATGCAGDEGDEDFFAEQERRRAEREAAEAEETEERERTSADLLKQDEDAWSPEPKLNNQGVIE